MTTHQHVFIGGLHRSGTSLLHRILASHPDISGFSDTDAIEDEGQHLQSVYSPANVYGGAGRFAFDSDAYLDESSPLVTDANRKALYGSWAKYWDESASTLIEKSPPNVIRSRFLQALFPGARFIFVTRDPVAVSLATHKWAPDSWWQLLMHWEVAHRILLKDLPYIHHYRLVRYEEFMQNPDAVLANLCDFLGCSAITPNEEIQPDVNRRYRTQWEEEIAPTLGVDLYARRLIARWRYPAMRELGYGGCF